MVKKGDILICSTTTELTTDLVIGESWKVIDFFIFSDQTIVDIFNKKTGKRITSDLWYFTPLEVCREFKLRKLLEGDKNI